VEAQRPAGAGIKHDVAVPVAAVPDFLSEATAAVTAALPGVRVLAFGHLGDGNIHFNLCQPRQMAAAEFLARTGAFNRLSRDEQGKMMIEHAMIGMSYGEAGHAFDIRLECHGIDRNDNEFVLGLVSGKLHRLSRLVKDMRRTRQTAEFMEKMGPFFIGRAIWQSPMPPGQASRPAY